MGKLITYENGLRVVVEPLSGFKSVASGIWVDVGSSKESPSENGLSHFTEHMMFKGTDKLDAYGIADAFESYGAHINAFTGKECTCYYVKSTDEFSEDCFALLAHIFFDSVFNDGELDKERKVILEEINMVEDAPEDICYDLLAQALYGKSPLGQTILGSVENVKRFKGKDVSAFINRFYCAQNIVISLAGNITFDQADAYVRKYVLPKVCINNPHAATVHALAEKRVHIERFKDFEQSNIAIGFRSIPYNTNKTSVQTVLNMVLGGGMSSRLFQSIRERLALAYSVYSTPTLYLHNGSFNILLNVSPENTRQVLDAVRTELKKILAGEILESEITRAKTQLKSALVFSRENVQSIMSANGKQVIMTGAAYNVEQKIAEIDAVTTDLVNEFARGVFCNAGMSTAYIGKKHDADFEAFSVE